MSNKHFTTNRGVSERRVADSRRRAIREMRLAEARRRKSQLQALVTKFDERAGR